MNKKCYTDTKHDGDPICRECALDLYGKLPKKKLKYPRNCWNCDFCDADELEDNYDN